MIDEKVLIDEIENFTMRISSVKSEEIKLYEKEYKKSILKIIDEQPKVSEWIPVEKMLPKENTKVLLCWEHTYTHNVHIDILTYNRKAFGDGCGAIINGKPIAWMLLPKPYEVTEND